MPGSRWCLVQGVDLRVADVLLDRVVLQEARTTEGLQRIRQVLVGTLGAAALDDRQEKVVDAVRELGVGARDLLGDDVVLVRGGVEVHRAQAFGVGLLHRERPADVRVVHDRYARGGLVGHLGQIGAWIRSLA